MENRSISISPSQKPGIEAKIRATTTSVWSSAVYCLTADRIPREIPITEAADMEISVSRNVFGKRAIISWMTGCLLW